MKSLFSVCIMLLVVASCSKKSETATPSEPAPVFKDYSSCKVVSWANINVVWDNLGRVKSYKDYEYSYVGKKTIVTFQGVPYATLFLNSNNYPDSGTFIVLTPVGVVPVTFKCDYNADNYLTHYSIDMLGAIFEVNCFYSNGNKVREEYEMLGEPDSKYGISYTYNHLPDSRKPFYEKVFFLEYHNQKLLNLPIIFGRSSYNQLVSFVADNETPSTIRYDYDADGKVIKEYFRVRSNPNESSFGVDYDCK